MVEEEEGEEKELKRDEKFGKQGRERERGKKKAS